MAIRNINQLSVGSVITPNNSPIEANDNALLAINKAQGQIDELFKYLPLTTVEASFRNNGVNRAAGEVFTWVDGNEYLVVDNGTGTNGIRNETIFAGILDGSLLVCTTLVSNMLNLFLNQATFNGYIVNWDTSNVAVMANMFSGASAFNQPIGAWNTSSLENAVEMFEGAIAFDQDISGWNTGNVITMDGMFLAANSFNQYLGDWDIGKCINMSAMFQTSVSGQGLSCENYTDTIVSWANQVNTNGVPLSADMTSQLGKVFATTRSGGAGFADAGAARTFLTTAPQSWTISGDTVRGSC